MNRNSRTTLLVVGGALIGVGIGYLAAYEEARRLYMRITRDEIQSVRDTYRLLRKEPPYDDPRTAVKAYNERLDELDYGRNTHLTVVESKDSVEVEEKEEVVEVEGGEKDVSKDQPYVISVEEFMDGGEEYDKLTILYFNKDDTLVDERDQVIDDVEGVVGPDALDSFGKGSDDANIVYVRNNSLSVDFEVVYDPRSYKEVVLGIRPNPDPSD